MKTTLLCVVLVALMAVSSANKLDVARMHQEEFLAHANSKVSALRRAMGSFQTRQTISPSCAAHLTAYDDMGCNTSYLNVISLMTSDDPLSQFEGIDPAVFCAAGEDGCHAKLFEAIPDCVEGQHDPDDGPLAEAIAEATIGLSIYTSMTCIKAGDEYCFNKFETLFGEEGIFNDESADSSDEFNPLTTTDAMLDQICDPCTHKVLGFVVALEALGGGNDNNEQALRQQGDQVQPQQQQQGSNSGPPMDVFLTLMCMKQHNDDGTKEYCFKKVMTEMAAEGCGGDDESSDAEGPEGPIDEGPIDEGNKVAERDESDEQEAKCMEIMFTKPCTDVCYRRVFGMMIEHPKIFDDGSSDDSSDDEENESFKAALRFACRRNAAGELCGTNLDFSSKYMDDSFGGQCTEETLFADKCADAGCKTALEAAQADIGCCFGSSLAFIKMMDPEAAVIVDAVADSCTTVDFSVCPRGGPKIKRKALLKATGLCAWYNANKASANAALIADFASNFGVDEEAIELVDAVCTAASSRATTAVDELSVEFQAQSDSDAHGEQIEDMYDNAVDDNNVSFNLFVEDFQADTPGVAVEFDNEQTARENGSTMVTATLSTAMAVLAVLALVL